MAVKKAIVLTNNKEAEILDNEILLIPNAGIFVNDKTILPIEISYLKNTRSNLQAQIDQLT